MAQSECRAGIDLYWLPLGAGGNFVRTNGRIFEVVVSRIQRRYGCDLYHSVVGIGPIGAKWLAAHFDMFRYELRRWRDGVIPDVNEAVENPRRLSSDLADAYRLLELAPQVPFFVWGRDELGVGDMWNSNSQIAWLVARAGLDVVSIEPPSGGRAPGWHAGLVAATRHLTWHPESSAAIAAGSITWQRP
jgi:hypothetical protein